jgi:hypothetical protein
MSHLLAKASLSEPHRRLVELMQQVNFGRIERLVIADGKPLLDPPPRIVRDIKFGGENGPRPEVAIDDFALKVQVVELFRTLDDLCDGVIEVLEIKHGLPFRMAVEDAA